MVHDILENGRVEINMGKEYLLGIKDVILEIGNLTKWMVRGKFNLIMEKVMMEIGKEVRHMVMVPLFLKMDQFIVDNGKITNSKALESKSGLLKSTTLVVGVMDVKTVTANLFLLMAVIIRVTSLEINYTAKENIT